MALNSTLIKGKTPVRTLSKPCRLALSTLRSLYLNHWTVWCELSPNEKRADNSIVIQTPQLTNWINIIKQKIFTDIYTLQIILSLFTIKYILTCNQPSKPNPIPTLYLLMNSKPVEKVTWYTIYECYLHVKVCAVCTH